MISKMILKINLLWMRSRILMDGNVTGGMRWNIEIMHLICMEKLGMAEFEFPVNRSNILYGQTEDLMDTYIRHYYKPDDVDSMLEVIINKKKEDIQKYGITGYQKCMKMNIKEHKNDKKGFWTQAKILN